VKKLLMLIAAYLVASATHADLLAVGTQEVSAGLGFDRDRAVRVDGYYGYFFMYGFSLGPQVSYLHSSDAQTWILGARGVKNINLGKQFILPFLAAGVSYASTDTDEGLPSSNDDAVVFRGDIGAKVAVTKTIALSAALILETATREVFMRDEDLERSNMSFEAGIHYAF
jgi:hypothetical protein